MYFKYHLHRRFINIFETLKTCNKQISINDAKYELYSVEYKRYTSNFIYAFIVENRFNLKLYYVLNLARLYLF